MLGEQWLASSAAIRYTGRKRILQLQPGEGLTMWPGILVPIIMFFGLSVFLGGYISERALESINRKK